MWMFVEDSDLKIGGEREFVLPTKLNTKARYKRGASLGSPRPVCHSPLTSEHQIQYGRRFEHKKGMSSRFLSLFLG